jgi:hypothetical protein
MTLITSRAPVGWGTERLETPCVFSALASASGVESCKDSWGWEHSICEPLIDQRNPLRPLRSAGVVKSMVTGSPQVVPRITLQS